MARAKYGVIVHAFSSGTKLPPRFHAYGYGLIHVQSQPDIPDRDRFGFDGEAYEVDLPYDGELDALVVKLAEFAPEFVLAGNVLHRQSDGPRRRAAPEIRLRRIMHGPREICRREASLPQDALTKRLQKFTI